ncbi:MAG: DUF502 domain-containing protein, partial [Planctomycetota bacterium]|nr:DUF502 domain-containing protein [Planctomycetota bacterium]
MSAASSPKKRHQSRASPKYFFIRGLAIILPPVLTLLILIWIGNTLYNYVIAPVNTVVRFAVAHLKYGDEIRTADSLVEPAPGLPALPEWGRNYRVSHELDQQLKSVYGVNPLHTRGTVPEEQLLNERFLHSVYVPIGKELDPQNYVPLDDYNLVFKHLRPQPPPTTATGLSMEVAAAREFPTQWHLSLLALSITILALYFLGRFLTARLGGWFFRWFEWMLNRVPVVRNVYATVKQLTDFIFSEREVEFNRVVAVEYPRLGAWSLGFLTGDGLRECVNSAGEPLVSVLVPASPMPMGGFTVMV